jgi:hypothetical protein
MVTRRFAHAAPLVFFTVRLLSAQANTPAPHAPHQELGTVHFPTSCARSVAPRFDRAVALLHSFEFREAIAGFNEILASDSTCAMAYWGIALSRWSNPMLAGTRSPAQLRPGKDAADAAARLSRHDTERERGYINAVSKLYDDYENTNQRSRIVAYERAMAAVVAAQPADTEAKLFYAAALIASAPPDDKTFANQRKAGAILEPIFAKQPNHPGVAHYLIHAYDVPPLAANAEVAAERYALIAPSSAHALHMPSHTFTRVGWWNESVRTNLRAVEAARTEGSVAEALHAYDYAMYAYLQMRNDSAARRIMSELPSLAAKFDVNAIGSGAPGAAGVFALAAIPARFALERRAWAEAASLVPVASDYPWTAGITYFVRALGAAHTGSLDVARTSIDSLAAIRDRLAANAEPYWTEQVAIQHLGALAWLRWAEHRPDSALSTMREAARREDNTEKSAVTPGPLAPARELLGDMLIDLRRPREALAEYRATLRKEPNRFHALCGAFDAASAVGDRANATKFSTQLRTLTGSDGSCRGTGDGGRGMGDASK